MTCCAVPCHADLPFHAPTPLRASSPSSPSIPSSPALPKALAAGWDPEGLGKGSPWDTAGPRGTDQHCQVPGTDLQGEGKAEGSGRVVTWPKSDSEEPVWWPWPSGSFQGRFRERDGDRGMLRELWKELPALLTPRGCGDQQFNYRDSPGSWHWAGERHCPPPEPPLAASSAPVHPEVLEIWLFSPFFPSFNLYPGRRETSPLAKPLGRAFTWAKAPGRFPCSFGKDELDSGRMTTRVFIPRVP